MSWAVDQNHMFKGNSKNAKLTKISPSTPFKFPFAIPQVIPSLEHIVDGSLKPQILDIKARTIGVRKLKKSPLY